jgi:D-aspartate ligase
MHRERPPAFVLNMYGTGLGIARNLARYGIPVVGISSSRAAPGHFSRYCQSIVGPDSQDEPEALLDLLISLGKAQSQRGILFPTRDADILFLDRYRANLEPLFAIPQPPHEVLDLILNKARLAQVTQSLGLDTPRTLRITSLEALLNNRAELIFPAVLKPVYAYQWRSPGMWQAVGRRKAIKVETFQELAAIYKRISLYQQEVLIQEWIHGPEDQFFILGAYFNRYSKCLGAYTAQKVLQFPPDFGLGCLVRTVKNEDVRSQGIQLLKAVHFTGIAEVEFKNDGRTGQYRLIEINPRHWDQHTLGTACGINLSYLAYLDLCAQLEPPPMVQQQWEDLWWLRGEGLLRRLKEDLCRGNFKALYKLVDVLAFRKKVYAVWDWRDPLPFLKAVTRGLSLRVRKAI